MARENRKAKGRKASTFDEFIREGEFASVKMCAFNSACLDADGDAHFIKSTKPGSTAKYYKIDCVVKIDGAKESVEKSFMMFESSVDKMLTDLIRQIGFKCPVDDEEVRKYMKLKESEIVTDEDRAVVFIDMLDTDTDLLLIDYVFGHTVRCGRPPKSYDDMGGFTYYKETFNPENLLKTEESVKAEIEARCGIVNNMPKTVGGIRHE